MTLMIRLQEFLRKIVSVLEMFSEEFESNIMNAIFKIAVEKVQQFEELKKEGMNFNVDCQNAVYFDNI